MASMEDIGVRQLKATLRKQIKETISLLDEAEIQRQTVDITRKVLELPEYHGASSISIFLAMPRGEVSTRSIVLQALKDRKQVFVPYIHSLEGSKTKVMDMMQLRDEDDLNSLKPDAWGIPSLDKDSIQHRQNAFGYQGIKPCDGPQLVQPPLDIIFMPAVAFDHSLRRLGHGKGFYDRYLSSLKKDVGDEWASTKLPFLVGLALDQQLLSKDQSIPTNELDWTVDKIVTADRILSTTADS